MKQVTVGSDVVSNVILGLMRIEGKADDEIRALYSVAREVGIDVFDHADVYATVDHACERRFSQALRLSPHERAEIRLQTKTGIVREGPHLDLSYEHIVSSAEGSLRALDTDYIDVLLLHRPDALVEPDEVARAFDELESSGKVRAFGVSNHTPRQIQLLKTSVTQPLVVNQLQLSLAHAPLVAQGVVSNMLGVDGAAVRDGGGVLDYCRTEGITVQAWSPFQSGYFTGTFLGAEEYAELNAVIDRLASVYAVPPIAIATAWITRHPADMQVVLGTTTAERVRGAALGSDLPLSRAEWYELFRAAGHVVP